MVKSKTVFRSPTVASQNIETELVLDGDDDAGSLLQEKEMDNLGGKSAQQRFDFASITACLLAGIGRVCDSYVCIEESLWIGVQQLLTVFILHWYRFV